jgi:hypothetical protein
MKTNRLDFLHFPFTLGLILLFGSVFLLSCKKEETKTDAPKDVWDIDKDGIPKIAGNNYIDLSKIARISKFRSSAGHDYSDFNEHCRSMKHYFEPLASVDWSTVRIYSPVTGTITRFEPEWAGAKIEIESSAYPAFRFSIFHVQCPVPFNVGDAVTAGQELGTHIGSQTYSDISVIVNDPTKQGRMVSWFEVMTDAVFAQYSARGVSDRGNLLITKSLRDQNPLTCTGDVFSPGDPLDAWVVLQ